MSLRLPRRAVAGLAWSCLAAACWNAQPAVAEQPPIEAFSRLPAFRGVKLSPTGKFISIEIPVDGVSSLTILPTDPKSGLAPKRGSATGWNILGTMWKTDDQLMVVLGKTEKVLGSQPSLVTSIVYFDQTSGQFHELRSETRGATHIKQTCGDYGERLRLVDELPNDPDHVLFASAFGALKIDIHSGQCQPVQKSNVAMEEWYLDEASTIRAATSYLDGTLTNWIVAPDGSLKALNTSKFGTGPQFSIFGVAGDGKHLLVFSDHETGRDAAYEYDPETRSFGRTLASDPRLDVGEPIYWSTRAVGVSVPHQVFFDPASARLQAEIDKALPETGNQIISMTRDGSAALVRGTSLDKPAVFYALTLAPKKKLAFLGSDYPELEKYKLATVRIVTYKARDGQAIEATLTTPPGSSGPIPFVILPHGGPTAADPRVFDYLAQFIASRGYGVLQPEFRGSTGFGTDFQRAGNAQWGGLMQRDVDDGTQWLIDQHMADRSRICMVGASYGGYAALYAAASRNDLYRCSAAWAPVSDLDALVHRLQAFDWEDPNIPNIGNGTSDLAAVSPVALAGKMSIPILIGHGEDDFTVPADQSHAMEAALRKAGGRVEAVYYKGENHFMTLESTRRDFFKRLQDFLARNIGQAS